MATSQLQIKSIMTTTCAFCHFFSILVKVEGHLSINVPAVSEVGELIYCEDEMNLRVLIRSREVSRNMKMLALFCDIVMSGEAIRK